MGSGRLLAASRADVVLREDVIECSSDPRPNAFFDLNSRVLRVYHGPIYGNPFSTVPANSINVGAFAPRFSGPPPGMTGQHFSGGPPGTPPQGYNSGYQSNTGKPRDSPAMNHNTWGGSQAGVNGANHGPASNSQGGNGGSGGNAMPGAWVNDNNTNQNNSNRWGGHNQNSGQDNQNTGWGGNGNGDSSNNLSPDQSGWGAQNQNDSNKNNNSWGDNNNQSSGQQNNDNSGWGGNGDFK